MKHFAPKILNLKGVLTLFPRRNEHIFKIMVNQLQLLTNPSGNYHNNHLKLFPELVYSM